MLGLPDLRSLLVGAATALVVLALVVLPFLTPAWVGFEQGRAQSAAWTGFDPADLRAATDRILADLVIGPPDFDVRVGGVAVLKPAERAHMRDVRSVFAGFYLAAGTALSILIAGWFLTRGRRYRARARYLRAVRAGSAGLAIALLAAGVVAAVAFDAAFEVFHRIFFPAGTYNFNPQTDRLVQLFPDAFWSESAMVVGAVAFGVSAMIFVAVGHRLRGTKGDAEWASRAVADGPAAISADAAPAAPGANGTAPITAGDGGQAR